jgi:hypothetical protein
MTTALKRIAVLSLCLSILPVLGGCPTGNPLRPGVEQGGSVDPIFTEARPKVFLIGNDAAGPMGTAFLVSVHKTNYLVTNFHVISQVKDLTVETETGLKYTGIQILDVDRQNDVAILSTGLIPPSAKGLNFTHTYETSQKVFVVGYPNMRSKINSLNFVAGVISDANYVAPALIGPGQSKNIQLTAPINPGNSGSPVLNERAEVIGVISWRFAKEADIQGGNYAVPFQYVSALVMEVENSPAPLAAKFTPGKACTGDDECDWIYFCKNGACQPLGDVGQACATHEDCYLPYYCQGGVCTKIGALGDACQEDSQCAPPNYCILASCGPLKQKGEPCAIDIDCVSPLYCIVGKCQSGLSQANGPCTQSVDCQAPLQCSSGKCQSMSCTSDQQCYPLFCILGSCKPLGQAGSPCGQSIDCKSGMKCVSSVCKVSDLSAINGTCTTDFDCQMPWYCLGGVCKDGSMVAKSSVMGTACTSDVQCHPPLYCIVNQCQPLQCENEACKIDADCVLPLACQGGKCTYSGPAPGAPCTSDANCTPPLYCIMGQCQTIQCENEPCALDIDCQPAFNCTGGICTLKTITAAKSADGEGCATDAECGEGLACQDGVCKKVPR